MEENGFGHGKRGKSQGKEVSKEIWEGKMEGTRK